MAVRVLVVDDVEFNRRLLEIKLKQEYYQIFFATNGVEAISRTKEIHPDIILMDAMMPEMNGFEAIQHIKQDPALCHIPIIMVTALHEPQDRLQGLNAGADDFLTKPINERSLLMRIKSLVRLKVLDNELRVRNQASHALGITQLVPQNIEFEGLQVLCIDDDEFQYQQISETLASRGITCDWRQHCNQDVLDELTTEYSLIIINTLMLSDDGLQVCALLRSSEKLRYTPILLIVDDSDAESLNMGLKLGANDYLVTPIERNELMARCTSQIKKKHYQNMLRRSYVDSLQQSILDDVTPLYNRRYFDAYLTQLLYNNTPMTFALLLLDLDQFKPINDSFGHQAGNMVLREMANRIIRVIRSSDLCARYGGDEFAAVILNVSAEQALSIAERIRQEIAEMPFDLGNAAAAPMCTISIGLQMVATPCDMTILQLLEETDKNLYKAKNLGRNRVCT